MGFLRCILEWKFEAVALWSGVVVDAICGSLSMRKLGLKVWRVMWRVEAWSLVGGCECWSVRSSGWKERKARRGAGS
jgi:hypothetical protein